MAEGISENGRVRQKTICYLGPIAKLAAGIPDEIREKVAGRIPGSVDWNKLNMAIRDIPLTFEELSDMKRGQLTTVLGIRQNSLQDRGRGSMPRVEGELSALTMIAKKSFDEMFETVGNRKYRMR